MALLLHRALLTAPSFCGMHTPDASFLAHLLRIPVGSTRFSSHLTALVLYLAQGTKQFASGMFGKERCYSSCYTGTNSPSHQLHTRQTVLASYPALRTGVYAFMMLKVSRTGHCCALHPILATG
ncbi:unnamed protein product [Rhizoctonia solani]|uniref:Uncharacterized protein n=1 Tax=Rhizoctonia solani TaxID=456999 RepID=A0A8H2XR34_9AGAM|nr:unnamed protein product [Rhizoctonia solani]